MMTKLMTDPPIIKQSEEAYQTLLAKYGTTLDVSDIQEISEIENNSTVDNIFVLQNGTPFCDT